MKNILQEIQDERILQDHAWGGSEHDDTLSPSDWVAIIVKHLGKSVSYPFNPPLFRTQLVRVAAIAVAAIEAYDRYEKKANNNLDNDDRS
jgi:hypothetical protein